MRSTRFALTAAAAAVALAGCGRAAQSVTAVGAPPSSATTSAMPATALPTATGTPTLIPTRVSPAATRTASSPPRVPATPLAAALPAFASAVRTVTAADLPSTYRAGCPTPPSQLRMLTLSYVDFTGHAQTGHLVVNAAYVPAATAVFADLYAHRFPIREMVPVDAYGGSDARSVAADNTAGFNCRAAVTADGTTSWSMHAYGEAIDVDPVENPYIYGGTVDPADGEPYVDRSDLRPGMAYAGGVLVEAFADVGWKWGVPFGDYQHFSVNGK
jgi:hypothetical protein